MSESHVQGQILALTTALINARKEVRELGRELAGTGRVAAGGVTGISRRDQRRERRGDTRGLAVLVNAVRAVIRQELKSESLNITTRRLGL